MKKYLLAASAAVAATLVATGASASVNIACSPSGFTPTGLCTFSEAAETGNFGDSFKTAQSFTDLYTFTLAGNYDLSFTITSTSGPISFSSLALFDASSTQVGPIAVSASPTDFAVGPGTYTIKAVGSTTGAASYSGTIDVVAVAVPEPATWGLMLVGVGALGMVTRRRARTARVNFG